MSSRLGKLAASELSPRHRCFEYQHSIRQTEETEHLSQSLVPGRSARAINYGDVIPTKAVAQTGRNFGSSSKYGY
jgi:hypothetical protein